MKRTTVLYGVIICLSLCLTAKIACAVCVTSDMLKKEAAKAAGGEDEDAGKYKTANNGKSLFVRNIIKRLLGTDLKELEGPTPKEQGEALGASKDSWQKLATPLPVDKPDETARNETARKILARTQAWANDGEIVIAATEGQIAIVVPGTAEIDAKTSSDKWKKVLVPHVAYVGPVDKTANTVTKDGLLSQAFPDDDPKNIQFFRYRY
jgi:hypothetical protein